MCGCPRVLQGDSPDFLRCSASIGRVSGLLLWLGDATGRYAVRTVRAILSASSTATTIRGLRVT